MDVSGWLASTEVNSHKFWHARGRQSIAGAGLLVGLIALVVALIYGLDRDWWNFAGAMVTAATTLGPSLALLDSERNRPHTTLCSTEGEINDFMKRFISKGMSAHIVSCELSWVRVDSTVEDFLTAASQAGKTITIFAARSDELLKRLGAAGIRTTAYADESSVDLQTYPRFTVINMGRAGGEELAVARGALPAHFIDVYTPGRHPQVISLAKAYISRLAAKT